MTAGELLKKQRLAKNLTMNDVSLMTGGDVDKATISRLETGDRKISFKAAFYLSEIYGLDMKEIAKLELGKDAKVKKVKIVKKTRGRKKGSANKPK